MLGYVGPFKSVLSIRRRNKQLAEITYKDALEQHGCLDMEDLQFEAEFLTWDQASLNSFTFACHLTSTMEFESAGTHLIRIG